MDLQPSPHVKGRPRPVHVALVGQLPPPVHGQSLAIQRLAEASWSDISVHPVRLDMSDSLEQVGRASLYKLVKLWRCAVATRKVLKAHAPCLLYYPPASGSVVPFLRDILFLRAVRPFAAGIVFHFHSGGGGTYACSSPLRRWLAKPLFGADIAIQLGESCPSDGVELDAAEVRMIPVGIPDPNVFSTRSLLGKKGPFRVLYVGHLSSEKGVDLLPEIAACVKVPIEFDVIGEWASETCRRILEPKLLQAGIRLHGGCFGRDKWSLFETADVLVFPSLKETQGLVAVEAMACGVPVVASNIAGIRDVITDGIDGFLVAPKDASAFASAITRICSDSALWQRMREAGRRRFDATFTLEAYRASMGSVFVDCMTKILDQD